MQEKSLKINFLWAIAGNTFYALCGYFLLSILTKTSSVETVGLWGVGQAVTLPVATFFSLKLSTVNITDVRNEYRVGHYMAARMAASCMSIVVASAIGFVFYSVNIAVIIVIMGVSQAVAEVRAYFLSNMQKFERLNLSTLSQVAEGTITLLCFGAIFLLTHSLLFAILGIIVSRLSVLFFYDIPVSAKVLSDCLQHAFTGYQPLWQWQRLWNLLRQAAPLALVAAFGNAFQNIPRLVMDKLRGRESVGYFTALSMILVAYTMVNGALCNTVLPRLSKYCAENTKAFVWLLVRLYGLNFLLGVCFVAVVFVFGKPLLTVLFTEEYAQHKNVMVMLAVSSCILSLFSVSNWGLNATRQFAVQVPIYAIAAAACAVFSFLLIPTYDMYGAVWSLIICYAVGSIGCLLFIGKNILNKS